MKKVLLSLLFFAAILASTSASAGTNTSDDVIVDPTNGKDPTGNIKKSSGTKYNFTLFNFFGTSTSSKSDSSTTVVTESKEIEGALAPKSDL